VRCYSLVWTKLVVLIGLDSGEGLVLVRLVLFCNGFVCLGTLVPIGTSEARSELMLAICVVAHLFPYSDAGTRVLIWLC
jgi:hypothetical protein